MTVHGRVAHAAFPHLGRNALLDASRLLLERDRRIPPEDAQLGAALLVPTEAVTSPRPGISIVPDRCDLRFDRRLLVGEDRASVLAEMEDMFGHAGVVAHVSITADPVTTYTGVELTAERWLPAWRADGDQLLRRSAAAAIGDDSVTAYRFCTNGSVTADLGIPTIGYGPGDTELAHQPDEWIGIDQLERAARGYAALAQIGDWRNHR